MKRILFIALLLNFSILNAEKEEVFTGEELNEPFVVHGRLQCYNGNPSLRIWIIGSNRILGISEREEYQEEGVEPIPQRLIDIFREDRGWFTKKMYGDFLVEPLAPDIKGHMRPIRVLGVENLVVTLNDEIIIDERKTK